MKVKELIELLHTMPQDAEVHFVNHDGCSECNEESMPNYHEVDSLHLQPRGWYPYNDLKNVVVLE